MRLQLKYVVTKSATVLSKFTASTMHEPVDESVYECVNVTDLIWLDYNIYSYVFFLKYGFHRQLQSTKCF